MLLLDNKMAKRASLGSLIRLASNLIDVVLTSIFAQGLAWRFFCQILEGPVRYCLASKFVCQCGNYTVKPEILFQVMTRLVDLWWLPGDYLDYKAFERLLWNDAARFVTPEKEDARTYISRGVEPELWCAISCKCSPQR
jgi:hypothetical protein